MADTKISAMTAATTVSGTEEVPIVQSSANKKATVAQLRGAPVLAVALDRAPTAGEVLFRHVMTVAMTLAATLPAYTGTAAGGLSSVPAETAASASADFVLQVYRSGAWTTVATVTYGASGVTPTGATAGGTVQTLAVGEAVRLVAPATADATLADFGFGFVGSV